MNKEQTAGWFAAITGAENVLTNVTMKEHTSFKVGGPADILVTPGCAEEIRKIVTLCNENEIPFLVMGNGSNLVVRDQGIRGVVIKLYDKLCRYEVKEEYIEAESGILMSKLSKVALENELTGIEFASGIPGTLGGAITMNAGAYGPEMKDVVIETECLDAKGNMIRLRQDQHQFGYRTSIIQKEGYIVLKSRLVLKKGKRSEITALMADLTKRRKDKQPLEMPSAGSVFRRPEGYFAGKLIEDCGLKGYRIGGAEVSQKHCGFIVNAGGATAADILNLIQYIQQKVQQTFGIEMHTEVKVVGEEIS